MNRTQSNPRVQLPMPLPNTGYQQDLRTSNKTLSIDMLRHVSNIRYELGTDGHGRARFTLNMTGTKDELASKL